jgi:hypothetical protein
MTRLNMQSNHPDISSDTHDGRPPIVSVIIPTYNRLALLREAVDSVRAQTFADWELIIADDGSTDETRPYLERLTLEDVRIRPLFLNHAGSMTVMRTEAIRVMRGEWIALLDSDDLWAPRKLEVQLGQLGAHPECGWSYTGYHHIDRAGMPVTGRGAALQEPVSGWIAEQLVMFAVAAAPPTLMMRRSLFEEAGGFDQSLHVRSDYDLMLRLAVKSEACGVTADLMLAREHDGRTSDAFPVIGHVTENESMFQKARANAPNARIRRLCAEQSAAQRLHLAALHGQEGRHSAALRSIMIAIWRAPHQRGIWRGALRQVAREIGLRA